MTDPTLKNLIQHFSQENLIHFMQWKSRDFAPTKERLDHISEEGFEDIHKLGEIHFPNRDQLVVCSIKVTKNLTERSGKKAQFDLAKKILKADGDLYDGIFVFHDSEGNFRLSLIYANYFGTRKEFSNYRRFTYYVSTSQTNNTFKDRMIHGDFSTLDGIKEAFSVEKVTKEFYKELSYWYFWACQLSKFPPAVEREENGRQVAVIRLITRLTFIWFMREKGLIPANLFNEKIISECLVNLDDDESSYYLAILQNLFFATLNTPQQERKFRSETRGPCGHNPDYGNQFVYRHQSMFSQPGQLEEYFKDIPFLNGGLFECLDNKEKGDYFDGFTDIIKNQPVIPNLLFFSPETLADLNPEFGTSNQQYKVRGLLETLSSYNFTIDENTADDKEVALDPELLGQVFENLLASFNPETSATARKATGSFYTPREIVDYMVEESLVNYLADNLKKGLPSYDPATTEMKIRNLLNEDDVTNHFSSEEVDLLINLINTVKVLDPACGSGAFPMGVLHKLVFILSKLDKGNVKWKHRQVEKAREIPDTTIRNQVIEEIEKNFSENELDYGRKLYLIENCIYGVDIQPIAVHISKLRFFISLLIDQKTDPKKENMGILPLPNLESKIVSADTLIRIDKPQQLQLKNPEIEAKEKQLAIVRDSFFTARTPSKKSACREIDRKLRKDISCLLKFDGWSNTVAEQLSNWDPYDQNATANFFDAKWMFGIEEGFDIVIGNPPYLESRHPSFNSDLKTKYQSSAKLRWSVDAKYITRGADLLIYFFENSIDNIKDDGCIILITQNSWLDTEYGRKAQAFLLRHIQVQKIIDSDYRYFRSGEGPNVNTVITVFKGKNSNSGNQLHFARFHQNFQQLKPTDQKIGLDHNDDVVSIQSFPYTDRLLRELKWGVLLNSSNEELQLIKIIIDKGKRLDELTNTQLTIGQGLNLTNDYILNKKRLSDFLDVEQAEIPFLTSDDDSMFEISTTYNFLLDKTKLNSQQILEIKTRGYSVFDPGSTRKQPPRLILPRGIGNRHFCALNSIECFSSSGVDVYDLQGNTSRETILNIWLYLNSSISWLIREIFGRKNLGGGMLKAEAVDLTTLPLYFEFGNINEIESIFDDIKKRQVKPVFDEVLTSEHRRIDKIVFDYLELPNNFREEIVHKLINKVNDRERRSVT